MIPDFRAGYNSVYSLGKSISCAFMIQVCFCLYIIRQ